MVRAPATPQVDTPQQPQTQPFQRGGDGRFGEGRRDGRPDFNPGQGQRGDVRTDRRDDRQDARRDDRRDDRRDWRQDNRQDGRQDAWRNGRQDDRRGYSSNYNRGWDGNWNGNNRNWNRDWRRDNRYNYNVYRNQNRNIFRLPRYYAPNGWGYGYRRFSIGFTLSSILFNQNYWIDDADYYRLPPAYGPYRWVRYYNDALLVDIRTGYVVDTVYDIFW
ncbi:hypothetical protein HMP06_1307 [Sphingomonas sp. HMP6]|nr:hypothetical protein HMP06_1307 [Sphingomonas sp. HMP6]